MPEPKAEIGEYVRTLLMNTQATERTTASELISELDYLLDVEGVERGEKKLERLRTMLKSVPPETSVATMSEWL